MGLYKHGMSVNNALYKRWATIKNRCNNPHNPAYERYGGKGIKMCDEWDSSFLAFYEWAMSNGYMSCLTIDRIDNSKGYSPDNCRWVTRKQQNRNKSSNRLITYNGKTQCIGEWSEETGIRRDTLLYRLNHRKSLSDVFKTNNLNTNKNIQDVRCKNVQRI